MGELKDRHVLLTGASAGIGAALARELSRSGARITLVARRKDALEALSKALASPCQVIARDLSDTAAVSALLPEAVRGLGPVDVLVNNAGLQVVGPTAEVDVDDAERSLMVNLATPLRLVRAVLPSMLERKSGAIVNIASMAALAPTPGMTWYNASKAGLAAASEALRGELRGTNIRVITVYPGIIADTDMARSALDRYHGADSLAVRLQPVGTADALASVVVRALERGKARVIWPRINTLARHFPATTRWVMDTFTPSPSGGASH